MEASPPQNLAGPIRDDDLVAALRERSPDHLRAGLSAVLGRATNDEGEIRDWRDLVMDLAPYHDCARRIGIDPRVLFEWIARKVPAEVAGPVRALGKRDRLDPAEFGFALIEEEDGPRYYWTR
jgi:hypothetical protein